MFFFRKRAFTRWENKVATICYALSNIVTSKTGYIGYPGTLEHTNKGLLVKLVNHYIT